LGRQALPDRKEMQDSVGVPDPLAEEAQSAVPNLIHRYPDRVVFKVSTQCAIYCRFCMRKKEVGAPTRFQNKASSPVYSILPGKKIFAR
jgi:lysine 2,3-aminomutase